MKLVHEYIYDKLEKLGIVDAVTKGNSGYAKFTAPGFMDLHVDLLASHGDRIVISLRHSYVQNGDSMADPDMEVSVVPSMKMAEAMTFQQDGVPGVGTLYQVVYPEPGKVNPKLKRDLNAFLVQWLKNIETQGHRLSGEQAVA